MPAGTVLGDPISTIFEAKIMGDTMEGKFYLASASGSDVKFRGTRQGNRAPFANPAKN
jgi:hypothetical protein